ncbi:MAG TPA: ribbon-helix-helix protein, CopG family [Candidatus Binataceae bacterium]|nr:ribbon-helix-helix protein, CopG family [Candidatus Binataceae bacterium]
MAEVLTIRIDAKSKKRLEKLAKATARTKSYLAAQAVRNYLDLNERQIAEIKKGIEAADRGEFASDAEVERVFAKIRGNAR